MASNLIGTSALFLTEATTASDNVQLDARITRHPQTEPPKAITKEDHQQYKWNVVWRNVIAFLYLHIASLYGLYLLITVCSWKTYIWIGLYLFVAALGVTAGAHRLWAHRSYKAKLPLRIILMLCQSAAFQNHIYEWVRDHRVHHKFTDTDADPHNAKRGFFFSHIGWLMLKKHKDVINRGGTVDMSDVEADPVVRFQKSFYLVFVLVMCFIVPAIVPWYFWGEGGWVSWYSAAIFRYTLSLNGTWLVNSAAHIWGNRPYDKKISPAENFQVAVIAFGEGWHNYHHVFPWDYKAAELGDYQFNLTTMVIDGFAKIGWAYDLKTVSVDMVKKRIKRTGDGSAINSDNSVKASTNVHHEVIWGWGDKDMRSEDRDDAKIFNKINYH